MSTAASSGQIDLAWDPATDDVGVTGYQVERCDGASCTTAQIAAPLGTRIFFSDTGVAASTSYSHRVRATDAAGNLGGFSNTGTALTPAPSTPAAMFTDDFNRTDANPITPTTVWLNSGCEGGAIVGNQLTGGTAGGSCNGDNFIFLNSVSPPANQYAKIKFASTANSGDQKDSGGPMVRASANGDGWLFDWISDKPSGNSTWTLFRVSSQTGTTISSGTFSRKLMNGDVIEIRAVGQLITGYVNGVAVPDATATDPAFPTGGFGMHLFHDTGRWDNFEGGSL